MKKNTNHFERLSQAQQAENALKEHRKRVGEVEYVTISGRTTFEFPVSLSEEEREQIGDPAACHPTHDE